MDTKEIEALLVKQQMAIEAMQIKIDKIYKVLIMGWISSFVKILIFIVLPIVLSIIYLPPLLDQFFAFYKNTLNGIQGTSTDVSALLDQMKAIK